MDKETTTDDRQKNKHKRKLYILFLRQSFR